MAVEPNKVGSCHKCAASLKRSARKDGEQPNFKSCPKCKVSYHTADCGFRFLRAGLTPATEALESCPKCTGQCFCCGGPVKCHAGRLRLKRARQEEPAAASEAKHGSTAGEAVPEASTAAAAVPEPPSVFPTKPEATLAQPNLSVPLEEMQLKFRHVLSIAARLQHTVTELQGQVASLLAEREHRSLHPQGFRPVGHGLMPPSSSAAHCMDQTVLHLFNEVHKHCFSIYNIGLPEDPLLNNWRTQMTQMPHQAVAAAAAAGTPPVSHRPPPEASPAVPVAPPAAAAAPEAPAVASS